MLSEAEVLIAPGAHPHPVIPTTPRRGEESTHTHHTRRAAPLEHVIPLSRYFTKMIRMVSVKAMYDGKELRLLEKVEVTTPQEVIVIFPDAALMEGTAIGGDEIAGMIQAGSAFSFLSDDAEDIYSDEDLKVRY